VTIDIKDRFASPPQPPDGLGGGGSPFGVIVIGKASYELRRAGRPDCFLLSRVGASYELMVRGGDWSCTCPAAAYRPGRPCKHAVAVATLRRLFVDEETTLKEHP
jgi:hypothetical protein